MGRDAQKAIGRRHSRPVIPKLSGARWVAPLMLFSALAAAAAQTLPFEPAHESGASVTGAFEGWFKNPDGSFSLLLGYFNRNTKQVIDLPVGPNNRIEPGGPDQGQPTHFLIGRQWGMFTIKVPADFGKNKLTWTISANGQTTVIPASLHPDYEISPFIEAAVGNTPPVLRFEENGPAAQGPPGLNAERSSKAGSPLNLTIWVQDDAKLTTPHRGIWACRSRYGGVNIGGRVPCASQKNSRRWKNSPEGIQACLSQAKPQQQLPLTYLATTF